MRRTKRPYKRPIRDSILQRAAKEGRPLTSEERIEISKERMSWSRSGYNLGTLLDEDQQIEGKLNDLLDETAQVLEDLTAEYDLEAIEQENLEEALKVHRAILRRQLALHKEQAQKLKQDRKEFRESLLRSGSLLAYLLAP
ncbi:hypothetical protein LCM28_25565 [Salipiger pacificus]|nr:hypothetical protein [Alloyangia pacifica]